MCPIERLRWCRGRRGVRKREFLMTPVDKIRNLAIVAHIDHGKTTLIDSIFRAAHVFRENQHVEERVMDSNELERERGITIRAKHCTVEWNDYLINIIDTPGHADFSGEVERVLSMVDSVLLLVDANEGPMPQTRYVLMRALRLGLRPIVIINKVDRPERRPATRAGQDLRPLHRAGRQRRAGRLPRALRLGAGRLAGPRPGQDPQRRAWTPSSRRSSRKCPPPHGGRDAPFRMQVSTLAWSDYVGRIGCGRVLQGSHRRGEALVRTVHALARPRPTGRRLGGRPAARRRARRTCG